jgi:hypothetical protein
MKQQQQKVQVEVGSIHDSNDQRGENGKRVLVDCPSWAV